MEYRFLGRTGLRVSTFCLGTANFGAVGMYERTGHITQQEADLIVRTALDAGVNLFNTAQRYSDGISEEFLGKALGRRRSEAIVITKIHPARKPGLIEGGLSRKNIIEGCHASLRRLKTDYIDVYQIHEFDEHTPLETALRALDDLVRDGKVRCIGCSNFAGWQLLKGLSISDRQGWERFATHEVRYSLASRMIEYEVLPACMDQDVSVLAWSPLHGGFLGGRYRRGLPHPSGTRFDQMSNPFYPVDPERLYDTVERLAVIAEAHGGTIPQAAINWVLRKPGVASAIVGMRTVEQLKETLAATEWQLASDEEACLDALTRPPMDYPYYALDMKTGEYVRHNVLGTYQEI
jgi:aryl-alcohol dehydrogenase-like predicted oxidoreductase